MIKAYDRFDTSPTHNGNVLHPISAYVTEEANGTFELQLALRKGETVSRGDLILAPTPRGDQYFRVYRPVKTLTGITVYAFHKFYDLAKNFLVDCRPTSMTCSTALQKVLDDAETSNGYTAASNITTVNTAYYIRLSPVQAIMSADNSILNTWGGCLIRDNDTITINASGVDRGYEVRLGKNLTGIEDDSDESGVVTRLYPTVVLGDNDVVYALPELYVDSPLLGNYGDPIIREVRVELTDEQKVLDLEDIYGIMRSYCNTLYSVDNVDKPTINYKVDFVELSKTAEYKDLAILEQLDLYDIVTVNVSDLDISVQAAVIKYTFDCLTEHYKSIELGDFAFSTKYSASNIAANLDATIQKTESAVARATSLISGNLGGYVVIRKNPDGTPYEILIMDTADINTAQSVIRWNLAGLGFSRAGYNGPYETAITIDGAINANFITVGAMSADRVATGILRSLDGRFELNLNNGTITLGAGFLVDDGETQVITTQRGYTFGDSGLIIDKADAVTKTLVDETGIQVQDKSGSSGSELFYAGVYDGRAVVRTEFIEVRKYIKIGNNARIEDYDTTRTGVFYVG